MIIDKKDNGIFADDLPIYFVDINNNYIDHNSVEIVKTDCGYTFKLNTTLITSVIFPCHNSKILIGDNYNYINTDIVSMFYSDGPTQLIKNEIPYKQINCPVAHLIDDSVHSISVAGECQISVFKQFFNQYIQLKGVPNENTIQFDIDISTNYLINLQRFQIQRKTINICNDMDISEIEQSIFYGNNIIVKTTNYHSLIKEIQTIQEYLDKNDITSVIIGSLAQYLNGIDCIVNDCDLLFRDMHCVNHAYGLLKNLGFRKILKDYKHIKIQKDNLIIDLSFDNYNINKRKYNIAESNGLRFFDTQGLMFFALLNLYEYSRTNYKDYYPKNDRVLFELTKYMHSSNGVYNDKVFEQIANTEILTKNCINICNMLLSKPYLYCDVRVNNPFKINAFGTANKPIFAIINTGSVNDCRIVTNFNIVHATWIDVEQINKEIKIENNNDLTFLYINQIKSPGIIICNHE